MIFRSLRSKSSSVQRGGVPHGRVPFLLVFIILSFYAVSHAQTFQASLNSESAVPPVATGAHGTFTATASTDTITFTLTFEGVSFSATQAHIHLGNSGTIGRTILWLCDSPAAPAPASIPEVPLCPRSSGSVSGTLTSADIIGSDSSFLLSALQNGNAYVDVHSALFPGNETRGQIGPPGLIPPSPPEPPPLTSAVAITSSLTSGDELPFTVTSSATGSLTGMLTPDGMTFNVSFNNLSANLTTVFLHYAQRGEFGGVITFLCSSIGGPPPDFPQPPSCPSGPSGTFTGSISAANIFGAHAQGIAPGDFATVVREILKGNIYVNLHSQRFPGGEIRGQLQLKSNLMIDTASLPDGTAGQPYLQRLKASGGSPPYAWSVLPVGNPPVSPLAASYLTLSTDSNNSDFGLISSKRIFGGTTVFTIQVTDTAGTTAKQQLSINTPCGFAQLDNKGNQDPNFVYLTKGFAQYLGGTPVPPQPPTPLVPTVPGCFGVKPEISQTQRQQCVTLKVGCALTSSAAMLAIIPNGSVATSSTPVWLDRQLSTPHSVSRNTFFPYATGSMSDISHSCQPQNGIKLDYCDFDGLTWAALMLIDQNIIFEDAPLLPSTFSAVDDLLEKRVCESQQGAILKLNKASAKGNHFVLATGRIIDPASGLPDWQLFDGGQNPAFTFDPIRTTVGPLPCRQGGSSPSFNQYSLRGHLQLPDEGTGGFCSHQNLVQYKLAGSEARFYSADSTWTVSPASINLSAGSPVELVVTDPSGGQLGNTGTGQDIIGIPQGSYFRDGLLQDDDADIPISADATATKSAYILNPVSGTYVVTITGTGSGTYHLSYAAIAADRSIQKTSAFGVASNGSINQFAATYSPVPGGTATMVRMASFDSTFADIQNSFQVGLVDNQGIANSLSKKVQAAQQANGSARASALGALKDELSAQSGKHITSDVAQMLSEDADWLINH